MSKRKIIRDMKRIRHRQKIAKRRLKDFKDCFGIPFHYYQKYYFGLSRWDIDLIMGKNHRRK